MTNQKAFAMESRALSGENLETELRNFPIHFLTTEYEPEECNIEQLHQKQERGDRHLQQRNERKQNITKQNKVQKNNLNINHKIQQQQQQQSQTQNNEHNNHIEYSTHL